MRIFVARRRACSISAPLLPASTPMGPHRFYEAVDVSTAPIHMVFLKALFLTALATGNCCAELAHFSRRALVDSGTTLTLGVMPRFLYKNQYAGRTPPPVVVPLFRGNPALCPVLALRAYIANSYCLSAS